MAANRRGSTDVFSVPADLFCLQYLNHVRETVPPFSLFSDPMNLFVLLLNQNGGFWGQSSLTPKDLHWRKKKKFGDLSEEKVTICFQFLVAHMLRSLDVLDWIIFSRLNTDLSRIATVFRSLQPLKSFGRKKYSLPNYIFQRISLQRENTRRKSQKWTRLFSCDSSK